MLLGYQGNLKEASSYVIIIITPPCMEGNLFIYLLAFSSLLSCRYWCTAPYMLRLKHLQ
jgi:hypothetical protein